MNRNNSFHAIFIGIVSYFSFLSSAAMSEGKGVFAVPISDSQTSQKTVLIDIQPVETCHTGDYDLIANELRAAKGTLAMQLSVEALGTPEELVVFGKPHKSEFAGGTIGTYEVEMPKTDPDKGHAFGVFLCSIPAEKLGKLPCSRQSLMPFNEMFSAYTINLEPLKKGGSKSLPYAPPKEVAAKVYFSQFLLAQGESLVALENSAGGDIPQLLSKFSIPSSQADEITESIKRYSDALGSLPLRARDNRIQIPLPFYSNKKCNG